jgi:membrane associated rhomboid family serine protease
MAWFMTQFFESQKGYDWMLSHFMLPLDKKRRRSKPHTVGTSAFSHMDVSHFLSNMGVLCLFVPDLCRDLGCRGFAYFYIASAYASNFFEEAVFSRVFSRVVSRTASFFKKYVERVFCGEGGIDHLKGNHEDLINELISEVLDEEQKRVNDDKRNRAQKPQYSLALGASGILSAVVSFHCLTFPRNAFPIGGRSVEAPVAALLWAINDLVLLHAGDGVGHGAHLGGTLFGIIVYIALFVFTKLKAGRHSWIG